MFCVPILAVLVAFAMFSKSRGERRFLHATVILMFLATFAVLYEAGPDLTDENVPRALAIEGLGMLLAFVLLVSGQPERAVARWIFGCMWLGVLVALSLVFVQLDQDVKARHRLEAMMQGKQATIVSFEVRTPSKSIVCTSRATLDYLQDCITEGGFDPERMQSGCSCNVRIEFTDGLIYERGVIWSNEGFSTKNDDGWPLEFIPFRMPAPDAIESLRAFPNNVSRGDRIRFDGGRGGQSS